MMAYNAAVSNPLRKPAICFLVVVLSCAVMNEFSEELLALGWHVRHGRIARLQSPDGKKYGVAVPIFWFARVDDGGGLYP